MKIQSSYTKAIIDYKKLQIIQSFSFLQNSQNDDFVSIYKFISHVPECFYSEEVFSVYFDWLKNIDYTHHEDLVNYFSDFENRLSNAIRNLNQINELKIHDEDLKGKDDYNLLEVIDSYIHPNYLKLIEGVFAVLIHPIAYFSRIFRNAGVEQLDVYNLVEEIQNKDSRLQILVKPYHHTMRNGIAHGSVEYFNNEIKYSDKKGNSEVFYYSDVISLFDELVDYCNAMLLALKVFFAIKIKTNIKFHWHY